MYVHNVWVELNIYETIDRTSNEYIVFRGCFLEECVRKTIGEWANERKTNKMIENIEAKKKWLKLMKLKLTADIARNIGVNSWCFKTEVKMILSEEKNCM